MIQRAINNSFIYINIIQHFIELFTFFSNRGNIAHMLLDSKIVRDFRKLLRFILNMFKKNISWPANFMYCHENTHLMCSTLSFSSSSGIYWCNVFMSFFCNNNIMKIKHMWKFIIYIHNYWKRLYLTVTSYILIGNKQNTYCSSCYVMID